MAERELVNTSVVLEKYPGKGGWTYAALPSVKPDKRNYFGWIRVSGYIDDYELKEHHLMPMGNGKLFLSVNATVRKKIKKQEGDVVRVKLYVDESGIEVPAELIECLADEPKALKLFRQLDEKQQKHWIDYIEESKSDKGRIERIAATVNRLAAGETDPFEADKKKRR
jgi:hypothetical protein